MYHAVKTNNVKNIIHIADNVFSKIEVSIEYDGPMPDFNRQFHYEFGAIGILGTSNVIGILEILTHDDNILQVGFQLAIGRVFPMGFKRSLNNVISEIQRAAEHAYNLPMTPQDFGNILLSLGSDELTHCYYTVVRGDRLIVTARIGNRQLWDTSGLDFGIDKFGIATKTW